MATAVRTSGSGRRRRLIAIIDIGSNSIRLVVYDEASRATIALFNEKATCALGQGLETSGRLNPDGVPSAHAALGRFVALARTMRVGHLAVLATSAVREASDGDAFVDAVERDLAVEVKVLSGEAEARLSGLGVISGHPGAEGLMADLGGGSLELQELAGGHVGDGCGTLPLGVLRLVDAASADAGAIDRRIALQLGSLPWLARIEGRALYAVGGSWRALARLLIEHTGHPLHVVDNYALDRSEAIRMLELFARQSARSLEKVPGLSRRRAPHLPLAALLLLRLLEAARPARLVFSAAGLREGYFFDRLSPPLRREDALLAACAALAREGGRFPDHGDELMAWMDPLFAGEDGVGRRRRHAACLLGDLFWSEHPDYRAEQAFLRVERLPVPGLSHGDRVAIALALHSRYQGAEDLPQLAAALRLLSEEEQRHSRLVGHLLRLANSVSGGVPGVLGSTRLRRDGDALVFEMPQSNPIFAHGSFERRFDRLARAAGAERLDLAWV